MEHNLTLMFVNSLTRENAIPFQSELVTWMSTLTGLELVKFSILLLWEQKIKKTFHHSGEGNLFLSQLLQWCKFTLFFNNCKVLKTIQSYEYKCKESYYVGG
jgi:hypothetical protein